VSGVCDSPRFLPLVTIPVTICDAVEPGHTSSALSKASKQARAPRKQQHTAHLWAPCLFPALQKHRGGLRGRHRQPVEAALLQQPGKLVPAGVWGQFRVGFHRCGRLLDSKQAHAAAAAAIGQTVTGVHAVLSPAQQLNPHSLVRAGRVLNQRQLEAADTMLLQALDQLVVLALLAGCHDARRTCCCCATRCTTPHCSHVDGEEGVGVQ